MLLSITDVLIIWGIHNLSSKILEKDEYARFECGLRATFAIPGDSGKRRPVKRAKNGKRAQNREVCVRTAQFSRVVPACGAAVDVDATGPAELLLVSRECS
jgi:hypothetical protein